MDSLNIRGYIILALWKNIGTTEKKHDLHNIICFGEPKHMISENLRPGYLSSQKPDRPRYIKNRITEILTLGCTVLEGESVFKFPRFEPA